MRKSKEMCRGCKNDIYNDPNNNPSKTKSCWMYKTARVKKRIIVGLWQNPPYSRKDCKPMLSCYTPYRGSVAIDCGASGCLWED